MQTNLSTESPQKELPSALLSKLPESLTDTSNPVSDIKQSGSAESSEPSLPPSALQSNEGFSALLERWNTAEVQAEIPAAVNPAEDRRSSSFSEQLKQSSHQLPSQIA